MSKKSGVFCHKPEDGISVVRIQMVRDGVFPYSTKPVRNSADAAQIIRSFLAGADREYFVALLLDGKHRVNALNLVAAGSLTSALIHPREVFKPAILANADCVIVVGHNHPSGDPSPSQDDLALSIRLVQAGEMLGIKVLDHIIVGDGDYISFADRGLISSNREGGWVT
jgi:DNA repair protein RadC